MKASYKNKPVLITGGLGFIGSNLAIRLVELGAKVTIVDCSIVGCGANAYNIAPVADRVRLIPIDIGDASKFRAAIRESKVIFNLAGEISHIHSMQFPERDLEINSVAQLRFLQECADQSPGIRIVYASTRQLYGVPEYLPVDEKHPTNPVDFNGVHKYVTSMYHFMLTRSGHIDAVAMRLTNVYGPRMALDIPCQGFLSTFLQRAVLKQNLVVLGDGSQLRDPVYVDDCVTAFVLAGQAARLQSLAYNVGGAEVLSLNGIAGTFRQAAGGLPITRRAFTTARKQIDIGSYYTDWTRIQRDLGWRPEVCFADGVARSLEYYRKELAHYLDPANPNPQCRLPDHTGKKRRLALVNV